MDEPIGLAEMITMPVLGATGEFGVNAKTHHTDNAAYGKWFLRLKFLFVFGKFVHVNGHFVHITCY